MRLLHLLFCNFCCPTFYYNTSKFSREIITLFLSEIVKIALALGKAELLSILFNFAALQFIDYKLRRFTLRKRGLVI